MRLAAPFCRVVVLAPGRRVDLALPTDVPVVELVAMLTERLVGRSGPGAGAPPAAGPPRVWTLTLPTGAELPREATLAGLGVLDGDLLRLAPRIPPPPAPVFDDPVDAVAQATPGGEWTLAASRLAVAAAAALAVLAAAAALAASRGLSVAPAPGAAVFGGLAAAAALGAALWAARRGFAPAPGPGAAALPLAAAAVWAGLPGAPGAGHLLGACVVTGVLATILAATVLLTTVQAAVGPLVAVITASGLGSVALVAATVAPPPMTPAGIGAAAAAVALGLLPMLPRAAARLAGLPPPVVPVGTTELVSAEEVPGVASPDELAARTLLAHRHLTGLIGGMTIVAGCGAALAGLGGGWAGPAFAALTVAVLLLRTRGHVRRAPVLVLLAGGIGTAGVVLAGTVATAGSSARLLIGVAVLALAGALAAVAVADGDRPPSPVLRRALDVGGSLLVAAALPLALAVLDIYRAVRAL